jgi:uncharacterized protein YicC (UPF0701 family)
MTFLGLKSREAAIFSIVYEYKSRNLEYYENIDREKRWAVCRPRTVMRKLSSLVKRGYLNKEVRVTPGTVKRRVYTVNMDNVRSALKAALQAKGVKEEDIQEWMP